MSSFRPAVGDLIGNKFSNVTCIHLHQSVTWFGIHATARPEAANVTVNVAAAKNRSLQVRRDPPLTFNRLFAVSLGVRRLRA